MNGVGEYLKAQRETHLGQLEELLSIPSISTDPERAKDVQRAAEWLARRLRQAGCTTAEIHPTARHPVVYGEWLGAPGAPTVLIYGHYDVQPVDPVELWSSPPFEPTVRAGKIFARGASDDKGQFIAHVNALEGHLHSGGGACPVNLKFVIEGEEEIGSPNLGAYLRKNRTRLACDVVVVSDTAMFAKGQPSICYGLRGLAYLEVHVRGTSRDLHSGCFGGAVVNPANALARMLTALKDDRGRVRVPGFYDKVVRLSAAERKAFRALPHSDQRFMKQIGAPRLHGEPGFSTLERLWARPTLDINGIWSGFTGAGAKTVIPAEARAKVSMRLVPEQKPDEIAAKVTRFLEKVAPPAVEVAVETLHGAEAWTTPIDGAGLRAAGLALRRAFGKQAVFVREGGSIPVVASFEKILRVPVVLMGFGLNDDNLHAPNEKFDLDNFYGGIRAAAYLMEELAAAGNGQATRRASRSRP